MGKKDNYPLKDSKFQGGGKLTPDTPNALAELLNDLATDANLIQQVSAATVAVAGGDTPAIQLDGEDWSPNAADYTVKLGKYDAVVDSVAQSGGVTTLTLAATPALSDYSASELIVLTVVGQIGGRSGNLAVGSVQLTGA